MATTTKKSQVPQLTLHGLLGAISFWGTSVRLLLMAFLAGAVLAAHVIELPGSYETEIQAFIYIVGSFFLLDAGYVMIARALPLKKTFDMAILLVVDLIIGLGYIVPNFAHIPELAWSARWTILIVLFVLSIRALIGLLHPTTKKR